MFLFYFLEYFKNISVLLLHLHLWVSSSSSAGVLRWHMEGPQADQTHNCEQVTSSFSSVISSFVKCTTILHQPSHRVEVKTKKNTTVPVRALGKPCQVQVLLLLWTTHLHFYSLLIICCEFLKLRNLCDGLFGFPFLSKNGEFVLKFVQFCYLSIATSAASSCSPFSTKSSIFFLLFWVIKLFVPEISWM